MNTTSIVRKIVVFGILLLSTTAIIRTEMNTEAADDVEWEVRLDFNEPDGAYAYAVFGEAPDANDGPPVDSYDEPKPPAPMTPYIQTWFNDNLSEPYNLLLKDYRRYPDTYKIWNLSIQWVPSDYVTSTSIIISWNISEIEDIEYTSVILYNRERNPLTDMITQNSYSFNCPANEAQQFQIICQSETSNGITDTIDTSSLILIFALIIIVIIALLIVYWKTKR